MVDDFSDIISEFVDEALDSLDKIEPMFVSLENKGYDKNLLNEIFRYVHTIKGAAGLLGIQKIVDISHGTETILKKFRDKDLDVTRDLVDVVLKGVDVLKTLVKELKAQGNIETDVSSIVTEINTVLQAATTGKPASGTSVVSENKQIGENVRVETIPVQEPAADIEKQEQTVIPEKEKEIFSTLKIDVTRIDKVMDLTGEIVLARNRLLNLATKLDASHAGDPHVEELQETVNYLDGITAEIQLAVMKMRMQPISKIFGKFPRIVRDMSHMLQKEIELEISGETTEVDKSVVENIGDPLVHLIRNAIDHGIEFPEERERHGKPKTGKININAYQKGTQIVVEISDDGRGIDMEAVRKTAVLRGIITEEDVAAMDEESLQNLIFIPGFSTKAVSSDISGRGVGMDVVRNNVSKLNGYVEVLTKQGVGTTFRISFPLTLAIIQAMLVQIGKEHYAVPQSMIEETIRIKREDIKSVTGQWVINIRDKVYPIFDLGNVLGVGERSIIDEGYIYVLVVTVGDKRFCISVTSLVGQEELVIKTVKGVDAEGCGILGATITGEGKVLLIIDLAVMARRLLTGCK